MTNPEQALEQARAAAESMRAEGAYPAAESHTDREVPGQVSPGQLLEWALIEPDLRQVRSDRRWGAPITALKRLLLRLLAQYHAELIAEQARFNAGLLRYVRGLEDRIEELERTAGDPPQREGRHPPQREGHNPPGPEGHER